MRGRPSVSAFYGIIRVHISFGITGGCQCVEPMWCFRSFSPPDGCAYGDKECLRERSEESGEEGLDSGPRTSQIRILLKDKLLQKSIVRTFLRGSRTRLFFISLYPNELQKVNIRGPFTEEEI